MENIAREIPLPDNTVKIIIGIFFSLLGVLLTLDNLHLVDAYRYLRYWPAVLLVIGLVKMTERGNRVVAMILTGAGVLFLTFNARWLRFSIFDLWPLALIFAGVFVVLHALGFGLSDSPDRGSNIFAVLAQRNVTLDPASTERRIIAFMGGCELDLPAANPDLAPVIIETVAVWGGVQIHVPEGWEVQGEVFPMMGGFEVKVRSTRFPTRRLIVRGLAFMGGVEVKRRLS